MMSHKDQYIIFMGENALCNEVEGLLRYGINNMILLNYHEFT